MNSQNEVTRSVGSILNILGYTLTAIGKFKDGKREEAIGNIARALGSATEDWERIKPLFTKLSNTVNNLIGNNHQNALKAVQTQPSQYGFFSGQWFSSDRSTAEYIYHDRNTNSIYLYSPKGSGVGYNIYSGGIDLNREVLVWTGFNSNGNELLIVGTPDDPGDNIQCHTWGSNPQSGDIELRETFLLSRIRNM